MGRTKLYREAGQGKRASQNFKARRDGKDGGKREARRCGNVTGGEEDEDRRIETVGGKRRDGTQGKEDMGGETRGDERGNGGKRKVR